MSDIQFSVLLLTIAGAALFVRHSVVKRLDIIQQIVGGIGLKIDLGK